MQKLRSKTFWTIYIVGAAVIFTVVLIYNISNYLNTRAMLHDAATSPFVDPRYTNFIIQGYVNSMLFSLVLFGIFLLVFYFVSKKLTDWIVKPAEESFAKQRDFVADASHELKTPLSVITASSESIKPTKTNKKYLDNIKEESSRMNTLISKLLTLASTESAENMKMSEGNLSKIVELSALTFEAKALEQNRKLKLDVQERISMKFNEDDIKQLVEILLDNALEHSNKNTTVELSLRQQNAKAILEVVNEGEGIAKGDEEKIFERFYRADKSRTGENNNYGLGLAIAKNIVQNHKGEISAKSSNGKTTFKVIF